VPLRVLVDDAPLSEPDARAIWRRFSAWMEAHPGDLGGFARSEGFASAHPELHRGEPVLIVSRVAPQRPYAPAPAKSGAAAKDRATKPRPRRRR
jgi:hypothetical protein